MESCPNPAQLQCLLTEELPPSERTPMEAHIEQCLDCQQSLEQLVVDPLMPSALLETLGRTPLLGLRRPQVEDAANTADNATTVADLPLLHFLAPGVRLDSLGRLDHYEILEVLGRGGFGIVFRAFDDVLERVVAIKVLASELAAASSPARKRFLREARAAAQVRHENVVQIHATLEQPVPYLVMEFVPGETLQQRLDRTGPFDAAEVVAIGRQIADGLAAAHAAGLIHRDIKPPNVLLEPGPRPRVKITDFGLARAADDASLTQSGVVAGTPLYMSPEQARGETLDHRTDLFSLGSLLYAITSGRPPFQAENNLAVLKQVAEAAPRPILEVVPKTPAWLCSVIANLMAKEPGDRFQSAAEVADLLAKAEAGAPPNIKPPRRRFVWPRWAAAGALAVACLLVGGLGVALLNHLGPPPSVPDRGADGPDALAPAPVPTPSKRHLPLWVDPGIRLPTPEELAARPSPLDALQRKAIPLHLLALAGNGNPFRAPAELVAVLTTAKREGGSPLALSPDSKTVALADRDGNVQLWDVDTAKERATLPGHDGGVRRLVFHPDGRLLATFAHDGKVALWEMPSGRPLRALAQDAPPECSLDAAFSPNGRWLAAVGYRRQLNVWDGETHQLRYISPLHDGWTLAVTPDSQTLIVGCELGRLEFYDLATKERLRTLEDGTNNPVRGIGLHPTGRWLAHGAHNNTAATVRIWDLKEERLVLSLKGHPDFVLSCAWRADGRLLATTGFAGDPDTDRSVRLWDMSELGADSPEEPAKPPRCKVLSVPVGNLHDLILSPEGRYLLASNTGGVVCILRLAGPGEVFRAP